MKQPEVKLKPEAHKARHEELHAALDELFADYINHHPDQHGFLNMPILQLIEWSKTQTEHPDETYESF
jgi:hypothetical protein